MYQDIDSPFSFNSEENLLKLCASSVLHEENLFIPAFQTGRGSVIPAPLSIPGDVCMSTLRWRAVDPPAPKFPKMYNHGVTHL